MSNQIENFEDIFKGIDAGLRISAQTAKRLAEQNGTPYVMADENSVIMLQHTSTEPTIT